MFAELVLMCSLLGLVPSEACPEVTDGERRPFTDTRPIMLDVDGDGKLDTITPRVYAVKGGRKVDGGAEGRTQKAYWISLSFKASGGREDDSFFKYRYGTGEAAYWVYAVAPCDSNKDGKVDLVFYSGDDTSVETVLLVNTGKGFVVRSRKVSNVE